MNALAEVDGFDLVIDKINREKEESDAKYAKVRRLIAEREEVLQAEANKRRLKEQEDLEAERSAKLEAMKDPKTGLSTFAQETLGVDIQDWQLEMLTAFTPNNKRYAQAMINGK